MRLLWNHRKMPIRHLFCCFSNSLKSLAMSPTVHHILPNQHPSPSFSILASESPYFHLHFISVSFGGSNATEFDSLWSRVNYGYSLTITCATEIGLWVRILKLPKTSHLHNEYMEISLKSLIYGLLGYKDISLLIEREEVLSVKSTY